MSTFAEQMYSRISRKGYRADDIKRQILTDFEIGEIPVEKVYEWVKTGSWKKKDFDKWLKALRVIE